MWQLHQPFWIKSWLKQWVHWWGSDHYEVQREQRLYFEPWIIEMYCPERPPCRTGIFYISHFSLLPRTGMKMTHWGPLKLWLAQTISLQWSHVLLLIFLFFPQQKCPQRVMVKAVNRRPCRRPVRTVTLKSECEVGSFPFSCFKEP